MEDAATAEISRSQVWQWIRHGAASTRRRTCARVIDEDARARALGDGGRFAEAREIFERVALGDEFASS